MYLDFKFLGLQQPENISIENIMCFIEDESTKRINFASSYHQHALHRTNKQISAIGEIILPFAKTIAPIFRKCTGLDLFKSQYNDKYYRIIKTEEEYLIIENFINKYKNFVFLRDNLDLSLTLSMNYYENNKRTDIGELEKKAKYDGNTDAERALVNLCQKWVAELPFYNLADYICAMPQNSDEVEDLPHRIIKSFMDFDIVNISDKVYFTSKSNKQKDEINVDIKLQNMQSSGLTIVPDLEIKDKTIILFDDLYMSGVSMQYVAMKLKEAGARRIFGLCIVKSRSNTTR